ncbi:endoribonuclease Dcr-1 [Galendromus occidentalis]|uniref:Endoribonuclease Dcr-1 n=1 Tax=Galendromus occidentalis TaxID=34638 RepID=A0AAJ7PA44_9ACAR|nr:endoribonuclease Dcr-1 [Galendromus occidentalis]
MPRNPKFPPSKKPAPAQIRARQNVLLENAQKKHFTPAEFQVELLAEAKRGGNKVIFISVLDKPFFIVNFTKENGYWLRPPSASIDKLLVVCLSSTEMLSTFQWLDDYTDLTCVCLDPDADEDEGLEKRLSNSSVILTVPTAISTLSEFSLKFCTVLIDRCESYAETDIAGSANLLKLIADRKLRVVGLTNALSGVGSAETARSRIQNLEKYWKAQATVCNDLTVLSKYGPKPEEKVLEYGIFYADKDVEYDMVLDLIENNLKFLEMSLKLKGNYSEVIQEAMRYPMELAYVFLTLGPWCAAEAAQEFLGEVSRSIDNLEYLTDIQISKTTLQIVFTFLQQFLELCRILVDLVKCDPSEANAIHPDKLTNLMDAILLYTKPKMVPSQISEDGKKSKPHCVPWHEDPTALCGLIIVRHRITALVVNRWLETVSKTVPSLAFVKSNFIIGQTTLDGDDPELVAAGLTRQEEVLQKFRYRDYNLLITTTATEDTLELPHCNLVVRFDPPESYKSYIVCKAKAKASSKCARFFIMLSQYETAKFTHLFSDYRKMEGLLLERSHQEDVTTEGDEGASPSDLERCYRPSSGDCLVATLSNSIAIINRYCLRLPSDTLTKLAPVFRINKLPDDTYQCVLRLPINSPLKEEIVGEPMATPVLAKQDVSLRALERLHKRGEIDDHLSPFGKDSLKAKTEDQVVPLDETVAHGAARPGTTKRRQYYHKSLAPPFQGTLDTETFFLYNISMKLLCAIPEEQNSRARTIYDPADSPRGFGFVSGTRLTPLCPFPIYTRSGEVMVDVEELSCALPLTEEQRKKAEFFHAYVFRDVLRLEKFPMKFDLKASRAGFLIIPITDGSVEWSFIDRIMNEDEFKPHKVDEEERRSFTFNREIFSDAVVMPWYRNIDKPQFFYVANICEQLTPVSEFPATPFKTFDDYYRHKYNIGICNKSQPLLDVDHTSARLNLLTPRYVNRKGVSLPTSSEESRKAKRENLQQKQILVPELCLIHPFPASLWRKVVCLPCILYRMNHLLLADSIRMRIVNACGVGKAELPEGFKWKMLTFGWTLTEVLKENAMLKQSVPVTEKEPVNEERIAEIRNAYLGGLRKGGVELTPDGQLVIDTFDPSKVTIPNDEELLEAELRDIDFHKPKFDWKPIPGMDEMNFRMGSPSNFEEESDWQMFGDSEMVNISMQGLNWISGEGIDIDKLSAALPLQLGGNADDSGDEGSLLEDMRDAEEMLVEDRGDKEEVEHNSLWLSPCSAIQQSKILEGVYSDVREVCDDLLGLQFRVCKGGRMGVKMNAFPKLKKALDYMEAAAEQDAEDQDLIEEHYVSSDVVFGELMQGREEMEELPAEIRIRFDDDDSESCGPSPAILLQALTMSNANDGINLERLETVGDSFLKYAITNYLYCTYLGVHEGKLSFLRSKQISNVNLYRLGKELGIGSLMVATKFEPSDNWLAPGFCIPEGLEKAVLDSKIPNSHCNISQFKDGEASGEGEFVPYSLLTHHSIPDKSIADCLEALIGAYLVSCGRCNTLKCMTWFGLRVLPLDCEGDAFASLFKKIPPPLPASYDERVLRQLLHGHVSFEERIGYKFKNKGFLLQAFTHASYHYNTLTDCYQRLEFLGDAVLDYLITRYLYEDPVKQHSPGALTDLRSALVNNTFFAALAVKYEFHKYFLNLSPRLFKLIHRFVSTKKHLSGKQYFEKYYLGEDECEEAEEIEVPKALGDIFESVAGAIYLDSGMSLDTTWNVYLAMMKPEIEYFSKHVPKSPIRELLELEPQTAKFEKAELTLNGKIRVKVEVFGKGSFIGIGRNKRIAKCTAAKRALRVIKGPRSKAL